MKASELVQLIRESEFSDLWDETFEELSDNPERQGDLQKDLASKGVVLANVDSYGGEGKGDTYWVVFSATRGDEVTHFKLDGWYASYSGRSFDDTLDFEEVEQVPVQVMKWRKK